MTQLTKENSLILKHYKEPLLEIPIKEGYGYYGAIQITLDGEKMQCHVCGKLFSNVSTHVRQAHKLSTKDYRDKFRLAKKTALISEAERARMKQNSILFFNSLSEDERRAIKQKAKEGRRKYFESKRYENRIQPKESLETKNKKGTCPDQLIAKIHEVAKSIGRTPTLAEFIHETGGQRYKHLIFAMFGSWLKALEFAKLNPKEKEENGGYKNYDNDELLELLSLYARENMTLPTATDCKRGFLPDYSLYTRHFGSFEQARRLAGVYDILT